jgi:hypothetical protein
MADWKENAGGTVAEFYREKCEILSAVLTAAPAGAGRDAAFQALLDFIKTSSLQKTNRLEWFLAVNGLVGRMSLDPGGFAKFGVPLGEASDPVIALYAGLEAAAPRSPDKVLPLI